MVNINTIVIQWINSRPLTLPIAAPKNEDSIAVLYRFTQPSAPQAFSVDSITLRVTTGGDSPV
jgi:hypothetical protein